MSFREKVSWISLCGILLAAALYFGALATHPGQPPEFFRGMFLGVTVVQVIVTVIATILVAALAPKDAGAQADERDRKIASQAAAGTYFPLLAGAVAAAITYHFGTTPFGMLNVLLGVIMGAEALRAVLQIRSYRRGWHA